MVVRKKSSNNSSNRYREETDEEIERREEREEEKEREEEEKYEEQYDKLLGDFSKKYGNKFKHLITKYDVIITFLSKYENKSYNTIVSEMLEELGMYIVQYYDKDIKKVKEVDSKASKYFDMIVKKSLKRSLWNIKVKVKDESDIDLLDTYMKKVDKRYSMKARAERKKQENHSASKEPNNTLQNDIANMYDKAFGDYPTDEKEPKTLVELKEYCIQHQDEYIELVYANCKHAINIRENVIELILTTSTQTKYTNAEDYYMYNFKSCVGGLVVYEALEKHEIDRNLIGLFKSVDLELLYELNKIKESLLKESLDIIQYHGVKYKKQDLLSLVETYIIDLKEEHADNASKKRLKDIEYKPNIKEEIKQTQTTQKKSDSKSVTNTDNSNITAAVKNTNVTRREIKQAADKSNVDDEDLFIKDIISRMKNISISDKTINSTVANYKAGKYTKEMLLAKLIELEKAYKLRNSNIAAAVKNTNATSHEIKQAINKIDISDEDLFIKDIISRMKNISISDKTINSTVANYKAGKYTKEMLLAKLIEFEKAYKLRNSNITTAVRNTGVTRHEIKQAVDKTDISNEDLFIKDIISRMKNISISDKTISSTVTNYKAGKYTKEMLLAKLIELEKYYKSINLSNKKIETIDKENETLSKNIKKSIQQAEEHTSDIKQKTDESYEQLKKQTEKADNIKEVEKEIITKPKLKSDVNHVEKKINEAENSINDVKEKVDNVVEKAEDIDEKRKLIEKQNDDIHTQKRKSINVADGVTLDDVKKGFISTEEYNKMVIDNNENLKEISVEAEKLLAEINDIETIVETVDNILLNIDDIINDIYFDILQNANNVSIKIDKEDYIIEYEKDDYIEIDKNGYVSINYIDDYGDEIELERGAILFKDIKSLEDAIKYTSQNFSNDYNSCMVLLNSSEYGVMHNLTSLNLLEQYGTTTTYYYFAQIDKIVTNDNPDGIVFTKDNMKELLDKIYYSILYINDKEYRNNINKYLSHNDKDNELKMMLKTFDTELKNFIGSLSIYILTSQDINYAKNYVKFINNFDVMFELNMWYQDLFTKGRSINKNDIREFSHYLKYLYSLTKKYTLDYIDNQNAENGCVGYFIKLSERLKTIGDKNALIKKLQLQGTFNKEFLQNDYKIDFCKFLIENYDMCVPNNVKNNFNNKTLYQCLKSIINCTVNIEDEYYAAQDYYLIKNTVDKIFIRLINKLLDFIIDLPKDEENVVYAFSILKEMAKKDIKFDINYFSENYNHANYIYHSTFDNIMFSAIDDPIFPYLFELMNKCDKAPKSASTVAKYSRDKNQFAKQLNAIRRARLFFVCCDLLLKNNDIDSIEQAELFAEHNRLNKFYKYVEKFKAVLHDINILTDVKYIYTEKEYTEYYEKFNKYIKIINEINDVVDEINKYNENEIKRINEEFINNETERKKQMKELKNSLHEMKNKIRDKRKMGKIKKPDGSDYITTKDLDSYFEMLEDKDLLTFAKVCIVITKYYTNENALNYLFKEILASSYAEEKDSIEIIKHKRHKKTPNDSQSNDFYYEIELIEKETKSNSTAARRAIKNYLNSIINLSKYTRQCMHINLNSREYGRNRDKKSFIKIVQNLYNVLDLAADEHSIKRIIQIINPYKYFESDSYVLIKRNEYDNIKLLENESINTIVEELYNIYANTNIRKQLEINNLCSALIKRESNIPFDFNKGVYSTSLLTEKDFKEANEYIEFIKCRDEYHRIIKGNEIKSLFESRMKILEKISTIDDNNDDINELKDSYQHILENLDSDKITDLIKIYELLVNKKYGTELSYKNGRKVYTEFKNTKFYRAWFGYQIGLIKDVKIKPTTLSSTGLVQPQDVNIIATIINNDLTFEDLIKKEFTSTQASHLIGYANTISKKVEFLPPKHTHITSLNGKDIRDSINGVENLYINTYQRLININNISHAQGLYWQIYGNFIFDVIKKLYDKTKIDINNIRYQRKVILNKKKHPRERTRERYEIEYATVMQNGKEIKVPIDRKKIIETIRTKPSTHQISFERLSHLDTLQSRLKKHKFFEQDYRSTQNRRYFSRAYKYYIRDRFMYYDLYDLPHIQNLHDDSGISSTYMSQSLFSRYILRFGGNYEHFANECGQAFINALNNMRGKHKQKTKEIKKDISEKNKYGTSPDAPYLLSGNLINNTRLIIVYNPSHKFVFVDMYALPVMHQAEYDKSNMSLVDVWHMLEYRHWSITNDFDAELKMLEDSVKLSQRYSYAYYKKGATKDDAKNVYRHYKSYQDFLLGKKYIYVTFKNSGDSIVATTHVDDIENILQYTNTERKSNEQIALAQSDNEYDELSNQNINEDDFDVGKPFDEYGTSKQNKRLQNSEIYWKSMSIISENFKAISNKMPVYVDGYPLNKCLMM